MEHHGQKMYVIDIHSNDILIKMCGYCVPRPGELLTIFDAETGMYNHYYVINVTHGTNTNTKQLVTTIHVKFYKTEKQQ